MESAAFSLSSPSAPRLRSPRQRLVSNRKYDPPRLSASPKPQSFSVIGNAVSVPHRRAWRLCSSASLPLRHWSSISSPPPRDSTAEIFKVKATASESVGEGESGDSLMKTAVLGLLFGLWYLFNIYFNIYNKQVRDL